MHQKLKASEDENGFPNLEPRQRPAEHRERVADVSLESRKAGARGRRAIQTVHGSSGVSVLGGIRCGQYIGKVSRGREQGAHCSSIWAVAATEALSILPYPQNRGG